MAGFRRIETEELSEEEKDLVMAFRYAKWAKRNTMIERDQFWSKVQSMYEKRRTDKKDEQIMEELRNGA